MKTKIYLADQIEELKNGKMALFGVYTDDVILAQIPEGFQRDAASPFGIAAHLLINFSEMDAGDHSAAISLRTPSGSSSQQLENFQVFFSIEDAGRSANVVIRFDPLQLFEGTSILEVTTANGTARHAIALRTQPSLHTQAPPTTPAPRMH